jgi:hypothetical protein
MEHNEPATNASMIDAGYFAKVVGPIPDWFRVPGVHEICSASTCISTGPDDWVDRWRHNEFGWFNTIEDAWSVVPDADRPRYRLFGYRIALTRYRNGDPVELAVPTDVDPVPIAANFETLGYDAISKSMESVLGFECSPLSCNGMADEIPVNEYCLFRTKEEAIAGAKRFSIEQPEPGDYYVVEVLEARSGRRPGA